MWRTPFRKMRRWASRRTAGIIGLEFGNVYEESWLGCEIVYPEDQIATTRPCCAGPAKNRIFESGLPGPFDGFMGQIKEYYEYCVEKAKSYDFHGKPVKVGYPVALGTDGPLTVANGIRGTQIFEDMLVDEEYYHRLMDMITEAIIQRIRAWRTYLGLEIKPDMGGFADDAIQFLSVKTYAEKVLPYHQAPAQRVVWRRPARGAFVRQRAASFSPPHPRIEHPGIRHRFSDQFRYLAG